MTAFCAAFTNAQTPVIPDPQDVQAYHAPDGYLQKFKPLEERVLTIS